MILEWIGIVLAFLFCILLILIGLTIIINAIRSGIIAIGFVVIFGLVWISFGVCGIFNIPVSGKTYFLDKSNLIVGDLNLSIRIDKKYNILRKEIYTNYSLQY